jgi:uncharacterized membrane-anchored protein YjiN (DUF445 family)
MKTKRAFDLFIVVALLFLFISEAFLREASLSSIKNKPQSLDSILSSVPSFLRSRIRTRLDLMQLRDNVNTASNDVEKINALTSLALYLTDEKEKEKLLGKVMALPHTLDSAAAFCYFLEKANSPMRVSQNEYRLYISKCPSVNRAALWQIGLQELKKKNCKPGEQLDFLLPLLSEKPDFYDYRQLYKTIYDLAARLEKKDNTAQKAEDISIICEELPTVAEYVQKMEKENSKGAK